jgi:hypothetical protein
MLKSSNSLASEASQSLPGNNWKRFSGIPVMLAND